MASAFFYGTLMHPDILRRVIGSDGLHLRICPAILFDHTRHRIEDCDYPGIIPYEQSKELFSRELTSDERSVKGTYVTGLNDQDTELLDVFEGDEYERKEVQIYPLRPLQPLNSISDTFLSNDLGLVHPLSVDLPPVRADAYIWTAPMTLIVRELWSFDTFLRDNLANWVGPANRDSYLEVDHRRAMNGIINRPRISLLT